MSKKINEKLKASCKSLAFFLLKLAIANVWGMLNGFMMNYVTTFTLKNLIVNINERDIMDFCY